MATNQGCPDSLDLGQHPYRPIPEADLSARKYFSRAVEQLSTPEKCFHSIAPRKTKSRSRHFAVSGGDENYRLPIGFNTQRGAHHVNVTAIAGLKRSQTEQGSLELGVTPTLKRTMSNVPFRPPFKELS